jgi:hypothetical protein
MLNKNTSEQAFVNTAGLRCESEYAWHQLKAMSSGFQKMNGRQYDCLQNKYCLLRIDKNFV